MKPHSQMGGESGNFVAKTLSSDDGELVACSLVGLEIECESRVVLLDQHSGRLLDCLRANATHFGWICGRWSWW